MKKFLLLIISVIALNVNAQTFEWGTAEWNVQDGWVFNDQADFDNTGLILTFPNPAGYNLTFLNIVAVNADVFVDDSTEPKEASASAQMGTAARFSFPFVEGHKYKVVTKENLLVQANLATYTTDTLSRNFDSYTISFEIQGPELVNTINVEATMSLAITDQNDPITASEIDVEGIKKDLGISDIAEATIYGLEQTTGQYVPFEYYGPGYFDGWKDNDGDYTNWNGGWNRFAGHNAYPAVYCVKINEAADSITYFFYDYWRDYNPDEDTEIGGSGITPTKRRVPETSYNSVVWDWDNGDGTTTKYVRNYRCNEGQDYKASFVITANKKYVQINATMHFVSIEDYLNSINSLTDDNVRVTSTEVFSLSGARIAQPQHGINIIKQRLANGSVKTTKIFVK